MTTSAVFQLYRGVTCYWFYCII